MHVKRSDSLQLISPGNLTMHHTVTVVFAGVLLQREIHGVEHLVQTGVANGMDGDLHAVRVCIRDHFVHVLGAEERETAGFRHICIRP